MRKYLLLVLTVLSSVFAAVGQIAFNNSWIKFSPNQPYSSQQYFKVRVAQEGLYRISAGQLKKAGIDVKIGDEGTVLPAMLQVFHMGQQQAVYMQGATQQFNDSASYMEFYAKGNNGFFDAQLYYPSPDLITNPYYSLFSDTAAYFVTWDPSSTTNKRISTYNYAGDVNGLQKPSNIGKEVILGLHDAYSDGPHDRNNVAEPEYVEGEGYTGAVFLKGNLWNAPLITTKNVATDIGPATAVIKVTGRTTNDGFNPDHHLFIKLNSSNFLDTTYKAYSTHKFTLNIPAAFIAGGSAAFSFKAEWPAGPQPSEDRNAVVYIKLNYPHLLAFTGETDENQGFYLPNNSNSDQWGLKLADYNTLASNAILYDVSNEKRINLSQVGNVWQGGVPNGSATSRYMFLSAEAYVNTVSAGQLKPVTNNPDGYARFVNYNQQDLEYDYLIVTHKKLMGPALEEYRYYRQANGYKPLVVDIDELYNQFAYGIDQHPISIRNFVAFTQAKYKTTPPRFLYLMGKSFYPTEIRGNHSSVGVRAFVPTIGIPSSDHLLTAHINNNGQSLVNSIATGRLSAENETHIADYLRKVKDYESEPIENWMKKGLHLGGGAEQSQACYFKIAYLDRYKQIFESPYNSGQITTFSKCNISLPIYAVDSIKSLFNNGMRLITFFGHSASQSFDFDPGEPEIYDPIRGRYPVFLANGCNAGDVHSTEATSSTKYTLIKDKGTINFIAPACYVVDGPLDQFSTRFYANLSVEMYGKSTGEIVRQSCLDIEKGGNEYFREVFQSMTLEGDPAIVMNVQKEADFKITKADISVDPPILSSEIDSFKIHATFRNIGKGGQDTVRVYVKRTFPNGTDTTMYISTLINSFEQKITAKFSTDLKRGIGPNKFEVFVDDNQRFIEISESNNIASLDIFIKSNEAIPAWPPNYGIIPMQDNVVLRAVTGDPFAPLRSYLVQVDTTDQFNSPLLVQSQPIKQLGGVIPFKLPFTLKEKVTYYWRVGLVDQNNWKEASFTYISGKTGWAQQHPFQFKNENFTYTYFNRNMRQVLFNTAPLTISAFTHLRNNTKGVYNGLNDYEYKYTINNDLQRAGICVGNGILAAVFDSTTGEPWYSVEKSPGSNQSQYGSAHCAGGNKMGGFDFYTVDSASQVVFLNFLNLIPKGNSLLLYSINRYYAQNFIPALRTKLISLGALRLASLTDTVAYTMFTKVGSGIAQETVGENSSKPVYSSVAMKANIASGKYETEKIGPARKWNYFEWDARSLENPSSDSISVDIIGVRSNGSEVDLKVGIRKNTPYLDLSSIVYDTSFVYLKLRSYVEDEKERTPAQINYWRVYYEGLPDIAINGAQVFKFNKDTLQEGQDLTFTTAFQNISPIDITDSVKVRLYLADNQGKVTDYINKKVKPLMAYGSGSGKDSLVVSLSVNTRGMSGSNLLWVEANPDRNPQEQNFYNNVGTLPFYIVRDIANPLLDVTFDGIHILNGDIVSPKPEIMVRLKDENKYLALNDTSYLKLWLIPPGASAATGAIKEQYRLYFKANPEKPELRFAPASLPQNVAQINLQPYLKQDGKYKLIAEGSDASNNASGRYSYSVDFEVINKSTITQVLNYPNPFSTSTRFVFTLTGADLPTYMKIQIITVSGKVVREIMLNELGPLHIGKNVTEYAWDGKDEFGDRLANGVYIYRVITDLNGKEIEKRETGADKYFVKGYGKMYMMK